MTEVRQSFSLIAGDDMDADYGLVPPPQPPIDLTAVDITWSAYPQIRGVADKTQLVVVKSTSDGSIEVTDPANYYFTVYLASADTVALSGNYYYEIVIIDPGNNNRRSTPTIGTMTVIDTGDPLNVVAFKSMFPSVGDIDDATLQTALDEAALYVDDSWDEQDFTMATFYLAGHFVEAAQNVSGTQGRLVTSERIGTEISVSYASATAPSAQSTSYPSLVTTSFGLMFLSLLRRNSPGIAVV
jgi:uncharacterized protein DUF4054